MSSLTKRQSEIYQYLLDHAQAYDYALTIDDVCSAMGVKSRGSMHKHIHALIDAGLIEPFNGQKRGIHLKTAHQGPSNELVTLPFMGKVAAGHPLEAIENPELMEIPAFLSHGEGCFILSVKGDSMMDAGILDGDWVIIKQTSEARNGDIVVALIDNYEATLKRFEKTDDLVILQPENKSMKPMIFNPQRVKIQGKLVGQMRSYF